MKKKAKKTKIREKDLQKASGGYTRGQQTLPPPS